MARTNRSEERRAELLPVVASVFAELGYRRTTTAALADRCEVQETTLYRLWKSKKAMFIASIEHVYDVSTAAWDSLLGARDDDLTPAERLLEYEATHHGEYGLYRIVFAGLSESDDDDVRSALQRMYRRYRDFIVRRLAEHAEQRGVESGLPVESAAWGLIGIGMITSTGRELGLLDDGDRSRLWSDVARLLVEGRPT